MMARLLLVVNAIVQARLPSLVMSKDVSIVGGLVI